MTTTNHPANGVPEGAPFDPRRHQPAPPPPQPSAWLEPVSEHEEVSDQPAPLDELIVVEDDGEAAEDAVDPVTGATPAGIGHSRGTPRRTRKLVKPDEQPQTAELNAQQRLLVLDAWKRSGLPAGDFAPLVGLGKHTLYAWKARFEEDGPAARCDLYPSSLHFP
jgi:hypothetical protein